MALIFCVKEKTMLAREATKADIQAVCDRLREAKEQRQLDIQINQAIAPVSYTHLDVYKRQGLYLGRTGQYRTV